MHFVALAMGLCVAMIAFVRLPSLKVSCLLLSGLLIYDVFWVSVWFGFAKTGFMLWICNRPWASFTWIHGMKLRKSGKARRWVPPLHSEVLNSTTGYRITSLLITWNKAEIRLEYFDFCVLLKKKEFGPQILKAGWRWEQAFPPHTELCPHWHRAHVLASD